MPKLDILTIEGKTAGQLELPAELFAAKINPQLMAQAVRVYLSNQRSAQAKSKTRGEIALTTKKAYRQKGTGRARHGARSAPIFVGGSKAHGPTGEQNYQLKLSKNMKRAALFSALTSKFQANQIKLVSGIEDLEAKTKQAANSVAKLELANQKFTLILPSNLESAIKAFRNLDNSIICQASQLNTYELLNGGILLIPVESIKVMEQVYLIKKEMIETDKKNLSQQKSPTTKDGKKTEVDKSKTKAAKSNAKEEKIPAKKKEVKKATK